MSLSTITLVTLKLFSKFFRRKRNLTFVLLISLYIQTLTNHSIVIDQHKFIRSSTKQDRFFKHTPCTVFTLNYIFSRVKFIFIHIIAFLVACLNLCCRFLEHIILFTYYTAFYTPRNRTEENVCTFPFSKGCSELFSGGISSFYVSGMRYFSSLSCFQLV